MNNIIHFPEGYRYNSDIELFKKAVNCAKEMSENGEMFILYQFINVISAEIFISQEKFEQKFEGITWNDFVDILNNEIIYLIRQNFETYGEEDIELRNYLNDKEVSEEWQEKIIELKSEKCKYVYEYLGGAQEENRYNLKKRSFYKKLSDIDYELSRTIDEEEVVYATIKMSVDSSLEGKDMLKAVSNVFNQSKENITFICDRSDIEYLIHKLEIIKQML